MPVKTVSLGLSLPFLTDPIILSVTEWNKHSANAEACFKILEPPNAVSGVTVLPDCHSNIDSLLADTTPDIANRVDDLLEAVANKNTQLERESCAAAAWHETDETALVSKAWADQTPRKRTEGSEDQMAETEQVTVEEPKGARGTAQDQFYWASTTYCAGQREHSTLWG